VPPETRREKQTASPYSTGGGGVTFEHRLGALLLTRLLTGGPVTALDELAPERVALQQAPDWIVDDAVVTARSGGGTTAIRLAIAARRRPRFIASDTTTGELITTLVRADIAADRDSDTTVHHRLAIAVSGQQKAAQEVAELTAVARGKADVDDFYRDIRTPGKYRTGPRLTHLTTMVGAALVTIGDRDAGTKEDRTFSLLKRLWIWQVDLEIGHEDDWTRLGQDLAPVTVHGTLAQGIALRDRLAQLATQLAQVSGNVDEPTLRSTLIGQLAVPAGSGGAAETAEGPSRSPAAVLTAQSSARRRVRLQVFGLEEDQLMGYFNEIIPPDVATGGAGGAGVAVLVGDFGSGKSEIAEAWHRRAITYLTDNAQAPAPVWLSARDITGPLQDAVTRNAGASWLTRGACVVVDGLDESDPARAQVLLDDARILAATYENLQILLTARPGAVSPNDTEQIPAPLLSEEAALGLVEAAGAGRRATWYWTGDMRTSLRRPFFALAAGVMLAKDDAPRGEADLIRALVENALSNGRERASVTATETHKALTALAVNLTAGDTDGLTFSQRQTVRTSRLGADGPSGTVRFSLPILQHWFAAQAILAGTVAPDTVLANRRNFLRWRWAAAVAALSATSTNTLDTLLGTWINANPGAAAWILREAFGQGRHWRQPGEDALEPLESRRRLLTALRTWSDALGDLSPRVLFGVRAHQPVKLGVSVNGTRLDVAISEDSVETDAVIDVPANVHPMMQSGPREWLPLFSGGAPQGDAWPWLFIRDRIAGATLKMLERDTDLGADNGIWVREKRYTTARALLGRDGIFTSDLPADEIRNNIQQLFKLSGGPDAPTLFHLGGRRSATDVDLRDLLQHLDSTGAAVLRANVPPADVTNPATSWVWSFYSKEQLAVLEADAYGRACEAYDEVLAGAFSCFGWSLPRSGLAPFGMILFLADPPEASAMPSPTLTAVRVPMPLLTRLAPQGPGTVWSENGRAVITPAPGGVEYETLVSLMETTLEWVAAQGGEVFGGYSWTSTGARDMSKKRPASDIAARWLHSDLKNLGLSGGTFPQLQ
jgi:hypothetical protein